MNTDSDTNDMPNPLFADISTNQETKAKTFKSIDTSDGRLPRKKRGVSLPPKFENIQQERRFNLEKLAAGMRLFSVFGYDEGVAGHITYRDPEYKDHFWVNPFGVHFSQISVSDLILCNHDGDVVLGDYPVNKAAFAIHSNLHNAHPNLNAAAHSHSMWGKSFSTLGKTLDPITQDACAFYNRQVLYGEFHGVVLDAGYGANIADMLADKQVVILQNHGLLTTADTVDAAVWYFIAMDRCCQAQMLAEATGSTPIPIPDKTAEMTYKQVGTELAAYTSFQPMLDKVLREQSDLLD